MAMLEPKVEIVLDLASGFGPFLKLDDPTQGQLDNSDWVLGGVQFIDITEYVKSVAVSRGRNSIFSSFPAGNANIVLNNHNRYFDPLYESSPFAGNIIPRREIRISSGTAIQFSGWVDDWNLSYLPNGDSVADAVAYDATSLLANRILPAGTPSVESAGDRVNYVLDASGVDWSSTLRSIQDGVSTLGDQVIEDNVGALTYLQKIAESEAGNVFIGKLGDLVFQGREQSLDPFSFVQFGGTGIPFQALEVVYGSENLYNTVVVSRRDGGTATATDNTSIAEYGARSLTINDTLFSDDDQAVDLALFYASRYSEPEYRFNSLEVALHKLSEAEQYKVANLELGEYSVVTFTPNNIGNAITQVAQIIRLEQNITPETHFVTIGFRSLGYSPLILDDSDFGKLNTHSVT